MNERDIRGDALRQLRKNSGLRVDDFCSQMGIARPTFYRWCTDNRQVPWPFIQRAQDKISATVGATVWRHFVEVMGQSLIDVPPKQLSDKQSVSEVIVYSYRYQATDTSFPSEWSLRHIEVEHSASWVNICGMWLSLPSIFRPSDFYRSPFFLERYQHEAVESYIGTHEARWKHYVALLGKRCTVRHLYDGPGIEQQIRTATISSIKDQIARIANIWLDCQPHFDIRVTKRNIPLQATLFDSEVVLVDLMPYLVPHVPHQTFDRGRNLIGMEFRGLQVVSDIRDQFEALWADRDNLVGEDVRSWLRTLQG